MNDPQQVAQPQVVPTQPSDESMKNDQELLRIQQARMKLESQAASVDTYKQAMQIETVFMNPNVWTQIRAMGKVFFEGKALPSSILNEPQLVMVLQAGFEMGMMPVESLKSLYIVKGTVNVYGAATIRRLRNHGWKIEYKNETVDSCTATVTKGDESYTETMTYQMAQKSGYTEANGSPKVGWKEGINRKLKLRYGVLSIIIKSYIPEVLGSASDIAEVAMDAPPMDITPQSSNGEVVKDTNVPNKEPIKPSSLADKLAAKREQKENPPEIVKSGAIKKEVPIDGEVEKSVQNA